MNGLYSNVRELFKKWKQLVNEAGLHLNSGIVSRILYQDSNHEKILIYDTLLAYWDTIVTDKQIVKFSNFQITKLLNLHFHPRPHRFSIIIG